MLMPLSTSRLVAGHRKRSVFIRISDSVGRPPPGEIGRLTGHTDMPRAANMSSLFAAVTREIEGEDAFAVGGALEDFRMAQGANGVVIAGTPVLLHAGAREVVVLRVALVIPGAIDQVHDVVDLVIALRPEQLRLGAVAQLFGELLKQVRHGAAQPLEVFETVGAGAGTAPG